MYAVVQITGFQDGPTPGHAGFSRAYGLSEFRGAYGVMLALRII